MPSLWLRRELRALSLKPPLSEVAGKYLHAKQNAPLSPYAIGRDGIRYQDLPAERFSGTLQAFHVSEERRAAWGSGSYAVAPDGSLSLADFHYDSSD